MGRDGAKGIACLTLLMEIGEKVGETEEKNFQ